MHTAPTHLPPVTTATLPFITGMSRSGSHASGIDSPYCLTIDLIWFREHPFTLCRLSRVLGRKIYVQMSLDFEKQVCSPYSCIPMNGNQSSGADDLRELAGFDGASGVLVC